MTETIKNAKFSNSLGEFTMLRTFNVTRNGSTEMVWNSMILQSVNMGRLIYDCDTHALIHNTVLTFVEPFFPGETDRWYEPPRYNTYGSHFTKADAAFHNFNVVEASLLPPWVYPPPGYPVHWMPIVITPPPYNPGHKASNTISASVEIERDCCCEE